MENIGLVACDSCTGAGGGGGHHGLGGAAVVGGIRCAGCWS